MQGVLNLNKPAGKTSRDIVNIVQRLVRPHKVGHAGTLDPLATGVLLHCVGSATRLISYAQQLNKTYRATFRLGERSETEDTEGQVELLTDAHIPGRSQLDEVLPQFVGQIMQVPPAYSALKLKGRRAYQLARQGETVELAPRPVEVHSIDVISYEYPQLVLDIQCGSGTYIRSLGRDIARKLGTEALMSALCRTAIGPFGVDTALDPDQLRRDNVSEHLLPAQSLLSELPQLTLNAAEVESISLGRFIENRFGVSGDEIAALDDENNLLAILKPRDSNLLGPKINFVGKN